MTNEYAVTDDDLKGGGGGARTAKPRGKYTGTISRPEVKKDKNGKVYLKFGIKIEFGKFKNGLAFENYLPLARDVNAFQAARRNSFFKAIALKAGSVPPGAPGGPDVGVLEGVFVDFNLEHEYENVPGEQYSLNTSKSAKSPWVTNGWQDKVDESGNLVVNGEKIAPRETLTFYDISDEFSGVGSPADNSIDGEEWG